MTGTTNKTLIPRGSPHPIPEAVAATLLNMATLGMSKEVVATLLEVFTPEQFHADHLRFLRGPVIQHRSPWIADTPSWMYEAITVERLERVIEEHALGKPGWQVGPTEIAAVIFPATMEAPMAQPYGDIYLWASAHANARKLQCEAVDIWEKIGGWRVEDEDVLNPGGRCHEDYRRFCLDVRGRVVRAQKERERRPRKKEAPHDAQAFQLDLF